MKLIYHGRVSSVVDSSDFPVGLLKEKKLSSPGKCSYKGNLNFHRRSSLYLLLSSIVKNQHIKIVLKFGGHFVSSNDVDMSYLRKDTL